MAQKTCLMIGGSGMAGGWIRNFVGNFGDRIKIIGLADVLPDVLQEQGAALGLSENQLFSDFNEACATVKADFCGVATPPPFHSPAAIAAMENGMPGDLRKADRGHARSGESDGDDCPENRDAVCDYPELPLCEEQAGVGSHSGGGTVGTAAAYRGAVRLRLPPLSIVGQGVAARYGFQSALRGFGSSSRHAAVPLRRRLRDAWLGSVGIRSGLALSTFPVGCT